MNEEDSWKLQDKMEKIRAEKREDDRHKRIMKHLNRHLSAYAKRHQHEDVDVDPPDEYNRGET